MLSPNPLRESIEIYVNANDEESMTAAQKDLISFLGDDVLSFKETLDNSLEIIHHETDPKVLMAAVLLICYAINPKVHTIQSIREKWMDPIFSQTKENLKKDMMIHLSYSDANFRNLCGFIISLIILLENNYDLFINICSEIYDHLQSEKTSFDFRCGLVHALNEVYQLPISTMVQENPSKFQPIVIRHFEIFLSIIQITQPNLVQLQNEFTSSLAFLFRKVPSLFPLEGIFAIVNSLEQNISHFNDAQIFNTFIHFLNDIVFFSHDFLNVNNVFPQIASAIKKIIEKGNISGFYFWYNLFDIESKHSCKYSYLVTYSQQLVSYFLPFIRYDQTNEDFKNTCSVQSSKILRKLNSINPNVVFPLIQNFYSTLTQSDNNGIYLSILTIYMLTTTPISALNENYIFSNFEHLLNCVTQRSFYQNHILALWILNKYFKAYGKVIWPVENLRNLLIDACINAMNSSELGIQLNCKLLYTIFTTNNDQSILNLYYDVLCKMFTDRINEPTESFRSVFIAFNAYISNTTYAIEENIQSLYEFIYRAILLVPLNTKIGYCSTLMTIINKASRQFIMSTSPFVLQLLIKMIEDIQDSRLWEETLLTVSTLLKVAGSEVFEYSGNVLQTLYKGYSIFEYSPFSLKILFLCFGNLFHFAGQKILNECENVISTIFSCVQENENQPGLKEMLPDAIRAMVLILESTNEPTPQSINNLEQLISYSFNVIDINSERSTLLLFLIVTCRAYSFIFSFFPPEELEQKCGFVLNVLKIIWDHKLFNENVLSEVYCLIYKIGDALQEKVNVRLSKTYIQNLINEGLKQDTNDKLKKSAAFVHKFIEEL